jgi:hypothetical protein
MSTLVIPDAPEAPMQNSDFRLSPAAPAPVKTMPGNGMPDVVRAKNLIKTKYEKIHKVKAKAGLACWSWADHASKQLLWSNYPTGDGEQLSWSDFSNEDGTALERMYHTNLHSRGEVDVTVREERHLVDVTWMMMHRAEPDVNNINYLVVRRCPPDEEMDGREPIGVSGDTALEKRFQEDLHRREEVPVSIRKAKHLVDVSSMMMHRVDATGNKNCTSLLARRMETEEAMDDGKLIDVSEESDGQLSISSSAKSSGSQR